MLDENEFVPVPVEDAQDFAEELTLEFDASHDPEAVWEWNGDVWAPAAA
jgi:hypothetical protein